MTPRQTDTKARILQTTRNLYSTHGSHNTTLDDIITAAGITKGAFYHYFKSKDTLCEAVIDQLLEDYRSLSASIDPQLSPIERLRSLVDTLASLNASGQWVNCRLIMRLSSDSHESQPQIRHKIQEFWNWAQTFYSDLIEQCRLAGQIGASLDKDTQTRLLMAVITGSITLDRICPSPKDLGQLASTVIDLLQ
jgi:TetR/AcrR family transcriptional repressor of nem operon